MPPNLPLLNLSLAFILPVVKGFGSWLPGVQRMLYAPDGGQTHCTPYCYEVWLNHLCSLWKHGMRRVPATVVELGPGNSLGTGYAALLSGAGCYVGVDKVRLADPRTNAAVLRELIELFRRRAGRPGKGWPEFDHGVGRGFFPSHILTPKLLVKTLDLQRLARLSAGEGVDYRLWDEDVRIGAGSADLVFSHAVLDHVDDLEAAHAVSTRWLKPGGWVSHQIDLHRLRAREHIRLLVRQGLRIVAAIPRCRDRPPEDPDCRGLYVIARKRIA